MPCDANNEYEDSLVQALEEYFLSPEFTSSIGNFFSSFIKNHTKSGYHEIVQEGEYTHMTHQIFTKYGILIEQHLSTFLSTHSITASKLYQELEKVNAAHGDSKAFVCLDYILSAADFMSFMHLMSDFVEMNMIDENNTTDQLSDNDTTHCSSYGLMASCPIDRVTELYSMGSDESAYERKCNYSDTVGK